MRERAGRQRNCPTLPKPPYVAVSPGVRVGVGSGDEGESWQTGKLSNTPKTTLCSCEPRVESGEW